MFRSEIIDQAHDQQHADRRERDVLASEFDPIDVLRAGSDVAKRRPPTQRCSDRKIRQQQQRTDYREQSSLRARCRINAAAVGKMAADDNVIDADQTGERANGQNNWQTTKIRPPQTPGR